MPTTADLLNRFSYHPPSGNKTAAYNEVRAKALEFAEFLNVTVPDGRELSLALTKLEEAVMWANAGIARDPLAHSSAAAGGGLSRFIKSGVGAPIA